MRPQDWLYQAALLLALARTAAAQPLQRSETYQATFPGTDEPGVSVLASGIEFGGQELTRTATSSPAGCAAACFEDPECTWFNWGCLSSQVRACFLASAGPSPPLAPATFR